MSKPCVIALRTAHLARSRCQGFVRNERFSCRLPCRQGCFLATLSRPGHRQEDGGRRGGLRRPEHRLKAQLDVRLVDDAVVAEELAQHFVRHRCVRLAPHPVPELRLHQRDGAFDVATLVVVGEQLLPAERVLDHLREPAAGRPGRGGLGGEERRTTLRRDRCPVRQGAARSTRIVPGPTSSCASARMTRSPRRNTWMIQAGPVRRSFTK